LLRPRVARRGPILVIRACDEGDGIAGCAAGVQDGYSTSGRLGVGLPGVRRLMDEFEILVHRGPRDRGCRQEVEQ
jgi:anti-sigma regulatory factor (Ser/Thr protein kinase)